MQKRIFCLYDLCSAIGTVLTLFMAYMYLCNFIINDSSFNPTAILFIVSAVIIDCILRMHAGNLIIYLLLHLIPFAILLIPGTPLYTTVILCCIGFFIFYSSLVYWKKDGLDKYYHCISFPDETIILYIIIFIHSYYGLSKSLTLYVYIAGISFFVISMLQKYLNKIISGIHSANGSNRLLDNKMYSANSMLVIIFTVFILLFIVGTSLVLSENSFNFIGKFLRFAGSLIASLIAGIAGKNKPADSSKTVQQAAGASQNRLPAIENADNPIANAIFVIMQIIIYFLIVVGVIYLIYTFFKTYMYRSKNSGDIIENADEKTDIKVSIKKRNRFKDVFSRLSAKEKIRRIYFKKISELQKSSQVAKISSTPDEIANTVKAKFDISIDELTGIYKKARYSNNEITREDVNYSKNL